MLEAKNQNDASGAERVERLWDEIMCNTHFLNFHWPHEVIPIIPKDHIFRQVQKLYNTWLELRPQGCMPLPTSRLAVYVGVDPDSSFQPLDKNMFYHFTL